MNQNVIISRIMKKSFTNKKKFKFAVSPKQMIYSIYNTAGDDPNPLDKDLVWSVLLFGEKIHIACSLSYFLITYPEFNSYSEKNKFEIYKHFKNLFESQIPWERIEKDYKFISQLRNKKHKNGQEMANLKEGEAWIRKLEKHFLYCINGLLSEHSMSEIIPLADDETNYDPDVMVSVPTSRLKPDSYNNSYFINIISAMLCDADEVYVADDRILPFIKMHSLDEYKGQDLIKDNHVIVFSDQLFKIPLCYSLTSNEIALARIELAPSFKNFNENLYQLALNTMYGNAQEFNIEIFKSSIETLRNMCPELQSNIDKNIFITKFRNEQTNVKTANIHLAFTSNKGIILLLNKMGMLTGDEMLHAEEEILKEAPLDRLRPFIFVNYQ